MTTKIRVASVCSGIGGAELAFAGVGRHVFASEIEPFPRAVLRHHFPDLKLYGDFRDIETSAAVDVLVGGTPCQSFSVAGLRRGMADERGNLALEYLRLVDRIRPRWVLWENVPGVLSSNGGRDFGAFLGGLGECGYGWAYRVLDAQYFGLAQRRKRVFVVGCLGDWRRACAVLFEPASLRGDTAPRREAREGITNALTERADRGGTNSEGQRLIAPTLSARRTAGGGLGTDFDCDGGLIAYGGGNTAGAIDVATAATHHGGRYDFDSETFVAYDVKGTPATRAATDAGEDGTGRGTPLVAFDPRQIGHPANFSNPHPGDPCHPLRAVANCEPAIATASLVRRLTPTECERLQGFPDGWTAIDYRGKPAADGPRYRALGNAFAVPVVRWIARRIAMADASDVPLLMEAAD